QNQQLVSGSVTDSLGKPLEGVSVLEEGTSRGTATDRQGRYQLQMDEGKTLVFRLVGFTMQRIPINGRSSIDIILSSESRDLEEIVVVGYGTQRKVNLTGSVSSVNFERGGMQSRPLQNVSSALA